MGKNRLKRKKKGEHRLGLRKKSIVATSLTYSHNFCAMLSKRIRGNSDCIQLHAVCLLDRSSFPFPLFSPALRGIHCIAFDCKYTITALGWHGPSLVLEAHGNHLLFSLSSDLYTVCMVCNSIVGLNWCLRFAIQLSLCCRYIPYKDCL